VIVANGIALDCPPVVAQRFTDVSAPAGLRHSKVGPGNRVRPRAAKFRATARDVVASAASAACEVYTSDPLH
jgi:hypothetical protein